MPAQAPPRRLRLAAVQDTANPAWRSFYPEDLPADWTLAFYAHFWSELLVPADHWGDWVGDPSRLEEVPEDLKLYFQVPEDAGNACAGLAASLGARLGGFLFLQTADCDALQSTRERLFQRVPDPVIAGASSAQAFVNGPETVLVVEPDTGLNLRQWRALLEALHAVSRRGGETLAFLRAGPDELEQAQTILRLSGLAWKHD